MKVGVLAAMLGRNAGGPETYEREFLRSLAAIDHENEYRVICLDRRGPQALGIEQENFSYQTFAVPSRLYNLAVSIPVQARRRWHDFLHATYIPPPYGGKPYIFTLVGEVGDAPSEE